MKRILMVGLLVALALGACDLFPNLSFDAIKGEWDFPDTTFNSQTIKTIHLSLMDPMVGSDKIGVDLSWNDFNNFHYGNGTMKGNVFTGIYSYNIYDPATSDLISSGTDQAITVTFSLSNDQLKAVFEGEGPLNGLILEHGTQPAA